MKFDYKILIVILAFVVIMIFVLKPKSDEAEARESDARAGEASTDKVKRAFSTTYGLQYLKGKNVLPSVYLQKVNAPKLTDSVNTIRGLGLSTAVNDPLNILPTDRVKQAAINTIYKFNSVVALSLFSWCFFEETDKSLEGFLSLRLTQAENEAINEHINKLKYY